MCIIFFFFFKQKPAYERRIRYWSSDVCSSGLRQHQRAVRQPAAGLGVGHRARQLQQHALADLPDLDRMGQAGAVEVALAGAHHLGLALQAPERRRVDDPALVALVGVADVVGSRRLGLAPFLESPGGSRTWRGGPAWISSSGTLAVLRPRVRSSAAEIG